MTSLLEGLPSFLEYYAQHQKFGYDVAKPNTPTYQWELFNTQFGAVPQMLAVLRKFGTDAHLYLPGIGTINGITAGNYFDSLGTTHASVDGLVGLVLDAAGSVGEELANGFNSGWIGTGWTFAGGVATASAATNSAARLATITSGKTYRVTLRCNSFTSGGYKLLYEGGASLFGDKSASGEFTANLMATTTGGIYIWCNSALTASFDKFEIKEVTGIHASQATTGYQPTLRRGIVNTVLGSHSFTNNTYWGVQGATASKSGGNLLTPNEYDRCVVTTLSPVIPKVAHTIAFELSGSGTCTIWAYNGTDGDFGLTQVTLTATPTIYVTAVSPTVSGSAPFVGRRPSDTATSITPRACGVFRGTLTASQILAAGGIPLTTTAPASSSAGAYKWEFDGVDDRFTLSSPVFQAADDYCVFASFTCKDSAATAVVFVQGAGPSRCPLIYTISGSLIVGWRDDTSVGPSITLTTVEANKVYAVSVRKVGNTLYARVNAGAWQSAVYTPSTTTVTTANIGCTPAGAVFFSGNVLYVSPIKGNLSQAEVTAVERGLDALSGYSTGGL